MPNKQLKCNKCGNTFSTDSHTTNVTCTKCGNKIMLFDSTYFKRTT